MEIFVKCDIADTLFSGHKRSIEWADERVKHAKRINSLLVCAISFALERKNKKQEMIYLFTFSCAIHHLTKRSHLTRGSKQIFCVLFFCRVLFLFFGLGLSFLPKERLCRFTGFPKISRLLFQQIFGSSYQQQQLFSLLPTLPPSFLERFSIACGCDPSNRENRRQLHHYTVESSFYFFLVQSKRGNTLLDWDDVASSLQSHCLFLIFIVCMYRTTNQQNLWSPFVMSIGCCCCRLFVQF